MLGLYKLVERRSRDVIRLEKYDGYWNTQNIGYDAVDYLYIPDSTVRLSRLQAGDLELAERIAPSDLPAIRADSTLALNAAPGLAVTHLMINVGRGDFVKTPIGQEPRLRKWSFRWIATSSIRWPPAASSCRHQMIPPSSAFYSASHPVSPRDLDAAKALIAEVGGGAKCGTPIDCGISILGLAGLSVPSFWLGIMPRFSPKPALLSLDWGNAHLSFRGKHVGRCAAIPVTSTLDGGLAGPRHRSGVQSSWRWAQRRA